LIPDVRLWRLSYRTAILKIVSLNCRELLSGVAQIQLAEASNYLNTYIQGHNLSAARQEVARMRDQIRTELDELSQQLVEAGLAA